MKKARDLVSENDVNFEEVLNQLELQRQQMEQAKAEAERLRRAMEETKQQSDAYYAEIKKERDKAVEKARLEAQAIIDDARRAANATYDELKQLRKQMRDVADAQGINERQAQLRRNLNEAEEKPVSYTHLCEEHYSNPKLWIRFRLSRQFSLTLTQVSR